MLVRIIEALLYLFFLGTIVSLVKDVIILKYKVENILEEIKKLK